MPVPDFTIFATPDGECFDRVLQSGEELRAGDLPGASRAWLLSRWLAEHPMPALLVVPEEKSRTRWLTDLAALAPGTTLRSYPAGDDWHGALSAREEAEQRGRDGEMIPVPSRFSPAGGERLAVLHELSSPGPIPLVVLATPAALPIPVPPPHELGKGRLALARGDKNCRASLLDWLAARGFTSVARVEAPGEFAVRGSIVDLFPPHLSHPCRLEFLDEDLEELRDFDPASQISLRRRDSVILAAPVTVPASRLVTLLDYFPRESLLARLPDADPLPEVRGPFRHRAVLFTEPPPDGLSFRGQEPLRFSDSNLTAALSRYAEGIKHLVIFTGSAASRERLQETVGSALPPGLEVSWQPGTLSGGFRLPSLGVAFFDYHDFFQRYRERWAGPKEFVSQPIKEFTDLRVGDFVVHAAFGIGKFLGLRREGAGNAQKEYLDLEFRSRARLSVPVSRLDLVERYLGLGSGEPELSALGGAGWEHRKRTVKRQLTGLAREMLELAAHRALVPGLSHQGDPKMEEAMVAAFLFEDTPDQKEATRILKRDLEHPHPMDRLLCGDVGYGKTELAMRAAFKAVLSGHQVAVLAPTTVLVEQHYRTFSERLREFPVTIAFLSRFQTAARSRKIIEQLALGQVDIVIGTHRLVSSDVAFKNLGLVVIDEEQRFGVAVKERLKLLRTAVDVLTMTATPIPRTLHMSLLGLKDISALTTPPPGRKPITTEVHAFSEAVVADAIRRELARSGQVFFLYNYVQTIERFRQRLSRLVPEARIQVTHGQLPDRQLEKRMLDFVLRRTDVLLTTTIIAAGVDIPNANTLLVYDADRFGLADLHQLRGRVGRFESQAYALLFLPERKPVLPIARKRLEALREYQELGAGFKLALRDLEIRGAGNLLGVEQHGHIAMVGYDMYCRLLSEAGKELKGEALPEEPASLDLEMPGCLPPDYVPDFRQKMDLYRECARLRTPAELEAWTARLQDRYGAYPEAVYHFLQAKKLQLLLTRLGVDRVLEREGQVTLTLRDRQRAEPLLGLLPHRELNTTQVRLLRSYAPKEMKQALVRAAEQSGA